MKTYIVIETADIEIIGVHCFLSPKDANSFFDSVMEDGHVELEYSLEELKHELEQTLRMAGDDSYAVQLIERDTE